LPVIARALKRKACEQQLGEVGKRLLSEEKNQGQLTTQDIFSKMMGQIENVPYQVLTVAAIVWSS